MKECPSFVGYSADSLGQIFSHRRRGVRVRGCAGTVKFGNRLVRIEIGGRVLEVLK